MSAEFDDSLPAAPSGRVNVHWQSNGAGQISANTLDYSDAANITSGLLPVARGGTGTATPGIVAGANTTVTGTWPNQTVNAAGGGSATLTTKGDVLGFDTAANRIPVGADGTILTADSTAALGVSYQAKKFRIPCYVTGKPDPAKTLVCFAVADAFTIPVNCSGSRGGIDPVNGANPTATATYTVKKYSSGTLSTTATVSVSTSGVFTFSTTGGTSQSYAPGDLFIILPPGTQDATLSGGSFTIAVTY